MEPDEINDLDRAATWLSKAIGRDVQRNDLLSWSGRGKLKICAAIPGEHVRLPATIRAHIERHAAALRQTNPAVGPAEAIDQAISRLSIEQRTELSIARLRAMQGLYPLHRFQVDAVRVHGHVMVTKARPLEGGDYVDFVEPARVTVEMLRITSDELQALRMSRSQPFGDLSRNPVPVQAKPLDAASADIDADIAAMFDPVAKEQLEAMFPDNGKWAKYAERAARNGLAGAARVGRAIFNPYCAARWWIESQGPDGWKWERCVRVLANNLPSRSRDSKHVLTGEFPE